MALWLRGFKILYYYRDPYIYISNLLSMKYLHIRVLAALLCVAISSQAQVFFQWQHSFGGSSSDQAYCVLPTTDNGYIASGSTTSTNGDIQLNKGQYDAWLVKITSSGNLYWSKTFGGTGTEEFNCVKQTSDGGFIAVGYTNSTDGDVTTHKGANDLWVVKVNILGSIVWQKSYGGSGNDIATSICPVPGSGYIVAGYTSSSDGDVTGYHGGGFYGDAWLLRLNDTGGIIWQKAYGGSNNDRAAAVQLTSDHGFITANTSSSNDWDVTGNHGGEDYWIVKFDSTGNISWQQSLGGSQDDVVSSVIQTHDLGYIISGSSRSTDGDVTGHSTAASINDDYWIAKLYSSGSLQWENAYGGDGEDNAANICQTTDTTYVVIGTTFSENGIIPFNHGQSDVLLTKIKEGGSLMWAQTFGGTSYDGGVFVSQPQDYSFVMAANTQSSDEDVASNHGASDMWIMKTAWADKTSETVSELSSAVQVFPTITSGNVYVSLPTGYENASLQLYNAIGQSFPVTSSGTDNKKTVSLSGFPAGLYLLKVIQGNESATFKIICRP